MSVITNSDLVAAHDAGTLIPWTTELLDRFRTAAEAVDFDAHPELRFTVIDITDFLLRVIEDAPFDRANPVNNRNGHDDRYVHYLELAMHAAQHPGGITGAFAQGGPA